MNWPISSNRGLPKISSVGGIRSPSGTPGSSGGTGTSKLPPLLWGGPAVVRNVSVSIISAARFVEVPSTNLAALMIDTETFRTTAGPPQSSGGNFDVPVPPLDPGVPLGDLIPPTELIFGNPRFEEIGQFINHKPEIEIQPENQTPSVNAQDSVDERGLPIRNGGESPGSGEIADGNGSNNSDPSETTTGAIIIDSQDTPNSVTINGV